VAVVRGIIRLKRKTEILLMKIIRPYHDSSKILTRCLGNINWADGILTGLDTETTSVETCSARIVSAALVTDIPEQEPNITDWLLKCPVEIPLGAVAVHGINNDHTDKFGMDAATGIAEILDALAKVDTPLVMVNAAYDLSILYCEALRYGLDTLVLDRSTDPFRRGRRTLTAVSASYGIPIKGAHTASGDVLCSLRLARAIGRKYRDIGYAGLVSLQEVQKAAYKKWASEFCEYRESTGEPIDVNSEWPYVAQIPV
jgi:DNA polymerase-3 subunit epsilon